MPTPYYTTQCEDKDKLSFLAKISEYKICPLPPE